ncbi:MAG: antibiotic biosynthesis monooxygenase [Gemmatimonadaceae bacterium]|nr:antibiotic biosynthesis monooxygenase [Gemmatimonadaceae bacterium]
MITLLAEFSVKPGQADRALALVNAVAADAQANQPGTLLYYAHRVLNGAGQPTSRLAFHECYADQAALQAHLASPSWQALVAVWSECFEGIPADVAVTSLDRLAGFTR